MKNKTIDYYGDEDNYIHLKFGDVRKMYHFTPDFREKYSGFSNEYTKYFMGEKSKFSSPFAVVNYAYEHNIPVHFYYNFTDTPATDREEIMNYLVNENSYVPEIK